MNKFPTVGDVITVTIKNDNRMFLVWRPATDIYTGTVVQPFSWLDADAFCLTGDERFPVRIIRISDVVKIVAATGEVAKSAAAPAPKNKWTIKGSAGNIYFVTNTGTQWSCTCIAGKHGRTCKHVVAAKKNA